MTRYGMVVDTKRCFGCHTCEVACKVANNMPKGIAYLEVQCEGGASYDTSAGEFPNNTLSFLPMQCQHCAEPACLEVCPTGATRKDEETGIVYVETEECIGCQSCISSCPYEGVRTLVPDEVSYYLELATGEPDAPAHMAATVEKCTFCRNLVSRGEDPACMQMCPGRARHWGDLDDPNSEVAQLIASRDYQQVNESAGTNPSIYYLV